MRIPAGNDTITVHFDGDTVYRRPRRAYTHAGRQQGGHDHDGLDGGGTTYGQARR